MPNLDEKLRLLALAGETITYGELARILGLRMGELTAQLEASMEEDSAESRPFRAVVLRSKLGDGLPALGFFEKAAALARPMVATAEAISGEREKLRQRLGAA